MSKPKCKGCQERQVGCHAKCESYLSWKKAHEEELDRIKQIKSRENDIDECTIANSVRQRRAWKRTHGNK